MAQDLWAEELMIPAISGIFLKDLGWMSEIKRQISENSYERPEPI